MTTNDSEIAKRYREIIRLQTEIISLQAQDIDHRVVMISKPDPDAIFGEEFEQILRRGPITPPPPNPAPDAIEKDIEAIDSASPKRPKANPPQKLRRSF